MKQSKGLSIAAVIMVFVLLLSLVLIVGTDTAWGKVETTKLNLTSADGDQVSAMLYKPKSASAENPVPLAMICHGGNDMLEQMGAYALELARRGYAVITWDYTGCHNSDVPTGTSETANGELSGLPTMGAETVWNTVKSLNFVDFSKIIAMGHSMGGQYTMAFSLANQKDVFLQVNLGMNVYGSPDNHDHNFNFVNILGVADESTLARTDNNVMKAFQGEQNKRIFFGDYETAVEELPDIEIAKVYTVTGSDGNSYTRTAYMPESCHAYYLVTNDAIQTVLYAITSNVGKGVDTGVGSYADHNKISTVWQIKDIGFVLLFLGTVGLMFVVAAALLKTRAFADLKLEARDYPSLKKGSPAWIVCLIVLTLLPVVLYRPGVLSAGKFLGMNISSLWLIGGTNNSYISWQWMLSLAMLAFFLAYHFAYGKKHGGTLENYGFASGNEAGFHLGYVAKAFLFGLAVVGSGYLAFSLVCAYTKQGMHIATFMISPINVNRTLCVVMYFLFQIPYFLTSSLAMKSIGIDKTEDTGKGSLKTILMGMLVSMAGLFLLWLVFILIVTKGHTLTNAKYFATNRMYIYTIAILPLIIGMTVANALNIYVSKKTKSIWTGLFTALLWGSWIIISCGGMTKYLY